MTAKEREKVMSLRRQGFGYKKIGQMLGVSVDTIKTFCRRNGMDSKSESSPPVIGICPTCGKEVQQNPGRKQKKFCSDRCRNQWWNAHLDKVNRKATYQFTCRFCKKEFSVYGNAERKYCSHSCYIEDRFGGARHGKAARQK